eukprot:3846121-Rhodomonas_salina.1
MPRCLTTVEAAPPTLQSDSDSESESESVSLLPQRWTVSHRDVQVGITVSLRRLRVRFPARLTMYNVGSESDWESESRASARGLNLNA